MNLPILLEEELDNLQRREGVFMTNNVAKEQFNSRFDVLTNKYSEPLWKKYIEDKYRNEKQFVNALFRLIELKDAKTATHSKAVSFYASSLAIRMGLYQKEIQDIHYASMLHDIGKVLVNTETLHKKDKLSEKELLEIKNHPWYGLQILEGFHAKDLYVDVSHHHHERYDGKGYPEGLSDLNISLETRIVSVADVIDAMSANRSYQKAKSVDYIISELQKVAGTQLDPDIASIAADLIDKKELILLG